MFELSRSSFFFEQMNSVNPEIAQNIEIVHENKKSLDVHYHKPKHFILSLNNLLRSLLFFIEYSGKDYSPLWLKKAVESFLVLNQDGYQMLRHLRNVSAHQKLIFPDESIITGLYKIRSADHYVLKLGHGDINHPSKYAWDLAFKNTDEIFHDMLVFENLTFMDLEHSSIGECLGITRRWYFKIKFKTDLKRYNQVVDVHELASLFSSSLLDHVCNAFAEELGIEFGHTFALKLEKYNYINTLLEIDIFPSLFSEWWEEDCHPINIGIQTDLAEGHKHDSNDKFHGWVYRNLTPDLSSYKFYIERFIAMEPKDVFEEGNFNDFWSFVLMNHWHYKKVFGVGINEAVITMTDVIQLQRMGNIFIQEYRKEKLCAISSTKSQLNDHFQTLLLKIVASQTDKVEI